jgi:hypothetical protein
MIIGLAIESETGPKDMKKKTSQSVSTTLTQGKLSLRAEMDRHNQQSTFEIYRRLDLGPGGYAIAPSTNTRRGVRLALRRKSRR